MFFQCRKTNISLNYSSLKIHNFLICGILLNDVYPLVEKQPVPDRVLPRSIIFPFLFTEKDKIDILNPDLKRALQLTTEDLRFIDYLVKQACFETGSSDIFLGKS